MSAGVILNIISLMSLCNKRKVINTVIKIMKTIFLISKIFNYWEHLVVSSSESF